MYIIYVLVTKKLCLTLGHVLGVFATTHIDDGVLLENVRFAGSFSILGKDKHLGMGTRIEIVDLEVWLLIGDLGLQLVGLVDLKQERLGQTTIEAFATIDSNA